MAFQFPPSPTPGQQHSPAAGITYEWDGTGWGLISGAGSATELIAPPGVIFPYAGNVPLPFVGWLLCDGMSYATASLPTLFAVIGYTYGGSGATFNVPDLRGRVIAGIDNMGGSAAGRLTGFSGLGGAGGQEKVELSVATLPSHTHGVTDPGHSHGANDSGHQHNGSTGFTSAYGLNTQAGTGNAQFVSGDRQIIDINPSSITTNSGNANIIIASAGTGISINSTGNTGSGSAHLNVQPTLTLNYIIRT